MDYKIEKMDYLGKEDKSRKAQDKMTKWDSKLCLECEIISRNKKKKCLEKIRKGLHSIMANIVDDDVFLITLFSFI